MNAASAATEAVVGAGRAGNRPVAERPKAVLLHCSGGSSRQWRALAEALQPQFDVHAIDLHGHGGRAPWSAPQAPTLADEVALAAHVAAQGEVHVVGHSYGAAVGIKLALTHPGQVRSLVVHEPVLLPWLVDDDAQAAPTRELLATAALVRFGALCGRPDDAARHFSDYWSGAGQWSSMSTPQRAALCAQMRTIGLHFDALAAERLDLRRLHARRLPMLCLTGAETVASMRRLAQLLRQALPAACHESLEGAGHMAPLTHRQAFNERVLAFLRHQLQGAASAGPAARPVEAEA